MCQETNYPYERIFCFFPPWGSWRSQQTVWCSDVMSVCRRSPSRGCTTHVWRCSRRLSDACRDESVACSATEKLLCALLPA